MRAKEFIQEAPNDKPFVKFMNKTLADPVDPRKKPDPGIPDWYRNAPTMNFSNMPSYKRALDFGLAVIAKMDQQTKQEFIEQDEDEFVEYLEMLGKKKGLVPGKFLYEDLNEVQGLLDEVFKDPNVTSWLDVLQM